MSGKCLQLIMIDFPSIEAWFCGLFSAGLIIVSEQSGSGKFGLGGPFPAHKLSSGD
jgi:hypothetical protein